MENRKTILIYRVLYTIIFIGLVFRFFYPFFSNPLAHLYSDPHRHHFNVIEGHFGTELTSILDPPVPQIILKAALFVFGDTIFGAAAYLGFLCAITPWCWYRWGRMIFPSKITALVFMAAITWLPSWISIYSYFMDEPILLPLLGISLWLSWRAKKKGSVSSILFAAVLWAITISIKLNVAFELIIVMTWLFFSMWRENKNKIRVVLTAGAVIGILGLAYLIYPFWVYKGLGFTWLFPPGMGGLNKGWHRSNAIECSATFIYQGKTLYQAGPYISNANVVGYLSPFSDWSSWRHGSFNYEINCNQPINLTLPLAPLSLKDRARNVLEETLHLLFAGSWPDDRADDPVQKLQIDMHWLWSLLIIAIIVLGIIKREMKNILVILCLGTIVFYIVSDSSMIEGRYRKPWEGIAIATFIFLCTTPKSNSNNLKPNPHL